MKKTFSLFLAFALGVVVPQTFAADYYVSPTGDDKAAGTSAETALKTIQAAIETGRQYTHDNTLGRKCNFRRIWSRSNYYRS